MDDLGFPLTKSPLVFLNASAEAVLAFNFSELIGVLLSNECISSQDYEAEAPTDVFIPRVCDDTPFCCLVAESCGCPCVSSRGRGSEESEKVGKSRAGARQEDEFLVLRKVNYIHVHAPLSSQGFSLILDARTYGRHSWRGRQMLHGFTQSGP